MARENVQEWMDIVESPKSMSWADEVKVAEGSTSKGKRTTGKSVWDNFDIKKVANTGFELNYVEPVINPEQLMIEIE